MRKILPFLAGLMLATNVLAQNTIDVYGTDDEKSQQILHIYSKKINQLLDDYLRLGSLPTEANAKALKKISLEKNRLIKEIQNNNDFLFVNLSAVSYPEDNNSYTTIEVVSKNQPDRLRFISPDLSKKKFLVKQDLINTMIQFEHLEFDLLMGNQIDLKDHFCPVYHCVTGFSHPKLKPYLQIFNTGVMKEKKLILNTLNTDSNPERRAAAALLTGHFTNPKEIISVLSSHIKDSSDLVRNDAMRVIMYAMGKAQIHDITIAPFLDVLDSPYTTDRNKALEVLSMVDYSKSNRNLMIKQAGPKLVALLQLKQPNNHKPAYTILKKISGKDYGEHDIAAWKKWLKANPQV